jgi:AraC-like DNA-binding protein
METSTMDGTGKLQISTRAFPESDQTEAFREIFGRAVLQIDMEPLKDHRFESEMTLWGLPGGIGVSSGFGSPMINHHTPDLIDNDDLLLTFMQEGGGVFEQHGRRTEVAQGDVVLTAIGEPAKFALLQRTSMINLRLSRDRLAPKLVDIGSALLAPVIHEGSAKRLMTNYIETLDKEDNLAPPVLRQAAATHLYDLAALALGATHDAAAIAKGRGIRAARLRAIKADILNLLTDDRLSLDSIARRHEISVSYLRQLFADEETTFSDYVLNERLALAHQMLGSSGLHERSIGVIALDCGFGDISYFNRRFRRRYGATPSDIRHRARLANNR